MNKTHRIVLSALFIGLTFIFTYFVRIPFPTGGYFNVGDAFIIISAILIDPFAGMLVGAVAGTFSDLLSGYALFIPFTIVAKGLEALIAGLIYHKLRNVFRYSGVILGPIVMVLVYSFSYYVLLDISAMFANFPFDLVQAGIAIILSIIILIVLERTPLLRRFKARK